MDWSIWGLSFSACFRDNSRFMVSPPVPSKWYTAPGALSRVLRKSDKSSITQIRLQGNGAGGGVSQEEKFELTDGFGCGIFITVSES